MEQHVTITLCLGSSCFTRGNNKILAILQRYIADNGLAKRCFLQGQLCEEKCQRGPRIIVNGTVYEHIHPDTVLDILLHHLEAKETP